MMTTFVAIFNYNMPEVTNRIFTKLLADGFSKEHILVVDNGSDKKPIPESANFILPNNIRFTGQSYIISDYLLNFVDFDNVLFITTSAGLIDDINYFDEIKKCTDYIHSNNIGFISSSLLGGDTEENAPLQSYQILKNDYTSVFYYQPIATLISKELLSLCREEKAAYFNLNLKRGWGIDRELQYIANKNNISCVISKSFRVIWNTNLAHKKKLADESVTNYRLEAEKEMIDCFSKKYGKKWLRLFKKSYYKIHPEQIDYRARRLNKLNNLLTKIKRLTLANTFNKI